MVDACIMEGCGSSFCIWFWLSFLCPWLIRSARYSQSYVMVFKLSFNSGPNVKVTEFHKKLRPHVKVTESDKDIVKVTEFEKDSILVWESS